MEERRLLSVSPYQADPIHVGAVYYEDNIGTDIDGDVFDVTFYGGAPGTQLTRIVIDTDKAGDGLSPADAFFDTAPGGLGVSGAAPFTIIDQTGIDSVIATVADGGTQLILEFTGFDPGETLRFSIDVDEQGNSTATSLVEGGEFQESILKADFTAPRYYDLNDVTATFWDVYDFSSTHPALNLPPDWYMADEVAHNDQSAGAATQAEQIVMPAFISGTVFEDLNLDGLQSPGELGIGGVSVSLLRWEGDLLTGGYVQYGAATTTNAMGDYSFAEIPPGLYQVVETQPSGFYDVASIAGFVGGVQRGVSLDANTLDAIELFGGDAGVDYDFAEAKPAELHGRVYHDANNNGAFDPAEEGIADAIVRLFYEGPLEGQVSPIQLRTAADGSFSATGLRPGTWRMEEVTPDGYLDGKDAVGSAGGTWLSPDTFANIVLASGQVGVEYLFGETLPNCIHGTVVEDMNGDGTLDSGDLPIADVLVELLDEQGNVIDTTWTDADGKYGFCDLGPGTYAIREMQPVGYDDGPDMVGTAGGSLLAPDTIENITLVSDTHGVNYDFLETRPSTISGHVIEDLNGNGVFDAGETPIDGALVELYDAYGIFIDFAITDSSGYYEFRNVDPGTYVVSEVQPIGYEDGADIVGSEGGTLLPPDSIGDIVIKSGTDATDYDFLEVNPASISGRVMVDADADGAIDATPTPIAGVEITLYDASGAVIATTLTGSDGRYQFLDLAPGEYRISESQPGGYFDGADIVGTAGGAIVGNDAIGGIILQSGASAEDYDFLEIEPSRIAGRVLVDMNANDQLDKTDTPLAGVLVELLDENGNTIDTRTTDAQGAYAFEDLMPGAYTIREVQPAGYADGVDFVGTAGGTLIIPDTIADIVLTSGTNSEENNFLEIPLGSISGRVHGELNGDCEWQEGEPLLEGVIVHLLGKGGSIIATTRTDAQGEYRFDDLEPGVYGVQEIQPEGYLQGETWPGSVGGDIAEPDMIVNINLGGGVHAVEYNFCEGVPATLSGYVFRDGGVIYVPNGEERPEIESVRDGLRTSDDVPLAGVTLILGDGSGAPIIGEDGQNITTKTDSRGYYEFTMLPPGVYTILEQQPEGYEDGIDTPGSHGGMTIDEDNVNDPTTMQLMGTIRMMGLEPEDAITRISVGLGDHATSNNFSEVQFTGGPPIIPPPRHPDPTPVTPSPQPMPGPVSHAVTYVPTPPTIRTIAGMGGGGMPILYTWHLSVLNGGQPRSMQHMSTPAVVGMHYETVAGIQGPYFDPVHWRGSGLDGGHWLATEALADLMAGADLGMSGAIPLAGDFNGDGIDEIAVYAEGYWFIDYNGNGRFDEGDLWAKMGRRADQPVVGDWDGDGKDDIGLFGTIWSNDHRALENEPGLPDMMNDTEILSADGQPIRPRNMPPRPEDAPHTRRLMRRTAEGQFREDVIDHVFQFGTDGDVALAGDWNGDGVTNIGLYRDGTWYFDMDGDGRWTGNDAFRENTGQAGDIPVVGDFNGDGIDDIGLYRDGRWQVDSNGDRTLDQYDRVFELGSAGDIPVVGDFDGDGVDDAVVFRHDGTTMQTPLSGPHSTGAHSPGGDDGPTDRVSHHDDGSYDIPTLF